jgi:phosphatidylglycerophosphatase A
VKRFIITFLGSACYAGYFPFASATFASFVWLLFYLLLPGGHWLSRPFLLIFIIPISIYVSREMELEQGEDSSRIVIDEVAGMHVTFSLIEPSITIGIVGFVLFRLFDVLKPFPINRSQRIGGGFGVVLDDLLAGAYARIVLLLLMNLTGLS